MSPTPEIPALEVLGRIASDGMFAGPALNIDVVAETSRSKGAPAAEAELLKSCIARAVAEITALMVTATGDAADMLAFQVAMLEDDALSHTAFAAITQGQAAEIAWGEALDGEIAGYLASDDEYFAARAADLRDIRDRVLRAMLGGETLAGARGAVLVGTDIAPTRFLETDWSQGGAIALKAGSPSSHVAMLARAKGIPMVVGLGDFSCAANTAILVDGHAGAIILNPGPAAAATFAARMAAAEIQRRGEAASLHQPARLADGTPISVLINVAGVAELAGLDPASCDGIGLMRSEFLFRDGAPLPGEDEQYAAYTAFLLWAGDKPVTIRTLDVGGDKPIAGLTPAHESNPFLGLRGVRLTLARPDVFKTQLRALARAAVHGNLKIMIPMVTVPEELTATVNLLDACIAELQAEGIAHARPPLGIMVEVPAVAIVPELFGQAAFFSIGSNDLTQYVTAASRDESAVAAINDSSHPAIARLLHGVATYGKQAGIPVSLCGDMASAPEHLATLIKAGITTLSVAPARLGRIKQALAELHLP